MKTINNFLKKKTIPIDKFMDFALYNNKFGYYMKKNPFGKSGDFITAPLISNLFSEMIAIWCVAFWEHLGKPKKIFITELGPGDATLCKDLLKTFAKFKDFNTSFEMKLLEKSPKLKKIQRNKIKDKKVRWIKSLNELKGGPIIFIANEFFDSLPIKQIYNKKKSFYERHVVYSKNKNKLVFLNKKAKKDLINKIKKLKLVAGTNLVEYPISAINYLKIISKKIKKYDGGLLIIDYGYIKNKGYNTLQAVKKHKYSKILSQPSNTDITSQINYSLFNKILKKNYLDVNKIVNQSKFLQRLGIVERANIISNKISFKDKANMFYRLKRLLSYEDMGNLFKVLFAQKKKTNFSLGFK